VVFYIFYCTHHHHYSTTQDLPCQCIKMNVLMCATSPHHHHGNQRPPGPSLGCHLTQRQQLGPEIRLEPPFLYLFRSADGLCAFSYPEYSRFAYFSKDASTVARTGIHHQHPAIRRINSPKHKGQLTGYIILSGGGTWTSLGRRSGRRVHYVRKARPRQICKVSKQG
jgi:hypothetical protein